MIPKERDIRELVSKRYFIMRLTQIGNIGANEIYKIKEQPTDGFETDEEAEQSLSNLLLTNKWPFNTFYQFSVLKLYTFKP